MNRMLKILTVLAIGGSLACDPGESESGSLPADVDASAAAETAAAPAPPTERVLPKGDAHYPAPIEVHRCLRLVAAGDTKAPEVCAEADRLAPGNAEVRAALEQLAATNSDPEA